MLDDAFELQWPGETAEYRAARNALAQAEHDLARAVEAVAAQRRALPLGGPVPQDYRFTEGPANIDLAGPSQEVAMSELFGPHGTLLLYSFMYDGSGTPCRMCTSLIDGYDGTAADLAGRVGFAVVAPAPLERLRAYGQERHWNNVRLVSSAGTTYDQDYGGVRSDGELTSRMNVFTRRDGTVRHFYATEKGPSGTGEDDRHLDLLWTLWGALDLTPEGRGQTWRPSRPPATTSSWLTYRPTVGCGMVSGCTTSGSISRGEATSPPASRSSTTTPGCST